MAFDLSYFDLLYFTGRRVRLTPKGAAKLLVPITVIYGLILKLVEFPGSEPRVIVEFLTPDGEIISGIYALEDVETLPVTTEQLREDLLERKVRFPRSSGIGIAFPPDATDDAVIKDACWARGKVSLIVWVRTDGVHPDAPFVTPADFTQCELVMRVTRSDTG